MENLMTTITLLNESENPLHAATSATKPTWQSAADPRRQQLGANRRRLNPATVGFWLGGCVLGTGGAIVGACMPYHHPVAVTISILWWAIFLGCFGASIGALLGLWKNRNERSSERTS
jgi:hypothetical protein